ncbi:hypothetical protein PR048_002604 [Dryococelus australis]|uniref:NADP-dependent oxidoreductase domain-containing protein n=1 Tax=Dryococelus australis TaxID=614101 RepID=A0ABQ9IKN2_9NEOP|nr:hypothetical protein PR048_002604 [Dryococelus australis]
MIYMCLILKFLRSFSSNPAKSVFQSKQDEKYYRCCVYQVECHPYLNQKKLKEFCNANDIVITTYRPLGAPGSAKLKPDEPVLLDDPKIKELASNHNKTPAQIALRYQVPNISYTMWNKVTGYPLPFVSKTPAE